LCRAAYVCEFMNELTGRIILVQEGRFLLEDDLGRKLLFILSSDNSLDPEQLPALARSGQLLRVHYSEPDHLIVGLAHSIRAADPAQGENVSRRGLLDTARGFLTNWSLPRQLMGESARTTAAVSAGSRRLQPRLIEADQVGTSICSYCAVGCAQLVYAKNVKIIHVEGDPRSPVNQGTLCPKGAATPLHYVLFTLSNRHDAPDPTRSHSRRECDGFLVALAPGHHCPSHSGHLVGKRDGSNLGGPPR